MDERGTVETGPCNHIVGPGKNESRLMIVDPGDIERYDRKVRVFIIESDTRYVFQFADEPAGKTCILLLDVSWPVDVMNEFRRRAMRCRGSWGSLPQNALASRRDG